MCENKVGEVPLKETAMIIESKTIKTYQPYLCPSGLDNSDKEWCAKDPKPVDYGKFLKLFSFGAYNFWKKPVEVRFAEAAKPVLESGVCYDVLPTSRDSLSTLIGEKKTDAGTWPLLPEAHEIYRLLIADPYGQPTDAKNRLTERTKRKAEKIHDGIKRARGLEDKGKAAEAQKIRLDLASEIDRVCVEEDGPDKSLLMKNEGQAVIDKYQAAQENYLKAKAWLAGKIALVAAAAWGLAKTGVLGKMRRAFRQKWAATKPPQDGGPVKRFFRNAFALPGRFLKSAWAAIRIKENIPPDSTTPPEGSGSAAGGDAVPSTGTGSTPTPAEPIPPPPAPRNSLAIREDVPEANINAALGRAENAVGLLAQAAEGQISDANAWLVVLRGELDSAETDIRLRFGWLTFMLRSQRALDFVSSLALSYMRRVFDETIPNVLPKMSHAVELIGEQKLDKARRLLTSVRAELSVAQTLRNELNAIQAALSVALEDIERLAQTPAEDFHTKAMQLLSGTDGLVQDSGIILDTLFRVSGMGATSAPGEMSLALRRRGIITSDIDGILSAVIWLNSHEAARRGGVKLMANGLGLRFPVPMELQGTILRLFDKAGNNGVRHSSIESLRERLVIFGAELSQSGILTLSVRDNGAGMTSDRVRQVVANGKKGSGISEMMRICEEHEWIFELSSEPNRGTVVKFKIDTAQWQTQGGTPMVTDGTHAPGSTPAAPPGTTSSAIAAAGFMANPFVTAPFAAMPATAFTMGAMTAFAPIF